MSAVTHGMRATLFAAAFALSAAEAAEQAPKFTTDVQPILDANCVACHQEGAAQKGLILESGKAYAALVGKSGQESKLDLIEPGDIDGSYLIHKIEGTQLSAGGQGARMPLGGELDAEAIDTIRKWVQSGAKDN